MKYISDQLGIHFLLYLVIGIVWQVRSQHFGDSQTTCAVLYSGGKFSEQNFTLRDNDQSTNLIEDFRSSQDGWNVTGSFRVFPRCELTSCSGTYFDGDCADYDQGEYETSLLDVSSLKCTCARECKCSDIYMKKSSCARGYSTGGCRTCNVPYTDMRPGPNGTYVPDNFAGSIEAFRLRKGCTLFVYDEPDHEGNATEINNEIVEDFAGEVRSYQCECDDTLWTPRVKPPRPSDYPELIDIPRSLDEVLKMLRESYREHPGLMAAYSSLNSNPEKRRSSKNAYILLLGATGAGKSSSINILFDNPNVTKVGGSKSTTTDIHEFRIPVPVDELGIRNSELRIIDTPGLGDTRGLDQDAKFLATLDAYLESHEELKDRIPNVVLIFHRFTDNRFEGEGSNFVRMLRGLTTFLPRITDDSHSNVVFVFSFLCSESKETRRNPGGKLAEFKRVIEGYSLFPKPIIVTVAENKPEEQELPIVNGYHNLPNNEYYPRNLFDKLELVTSTSGDTIGQAVFRSAFRDSDDFNVSVHDFHLVTATSSKVAPYLDILKNVIFNINKTEVSEQLAKTHETMDVNLKKTYPHALQYLQKALSIRGVNSMQDVPRMNEDVLKLLTAIQQNDVTVYLLEKGLNVIAPTFPHDTVAGYGYNVFKDAPLPSSPFKLEGMRHSDIGFMIPSLLSCKIVHKSAEVFHLINSKEDYIKLRLKTLGIGGHISEVEFKGDTKPGYNINTVAFGANSSKLTANREIQQFELEISSNYELTEEFKSTVQNLGSFNETDHDSVNRWNAFFSEYGTHVVKSVHGGGLVEIELSSDTPLDGNFAEALFDLVRFEGDMSVSLPKDGNDSLTTSRTVLKDGTSHSLWFFGGDQKYHVQDLTKLTMEDASQLLTNWKRSLKFNPVILPSDMKLIPMSQIVKKMGIVGRRYSAEIERATELRFNSSLTYSKPKDTSFEIPPDRASTPMMLEFMRMINQSNAQIQSLMLEMKRLEQENINRTLIMQQERLQYQEQEANRTREFQEKIFEMQQNSTKDRHKWEKETEDTRIQNENARAARDMQYQQQLAASQKAADKRLQDLVNVLATRPPPPKKSSCLKEGTPILMADWREKPVENLEIGDWVLDHQLKPTKVLGVAYEFLFDQTFYGFDKSTFFFTESHIFAGPKQDDDTEGVALYTPSPSRLFSLNPLMEYLNIGEMKEKEAQLFLLNNTSMRDSKLTTQQVRAIPDPGYYAEDTKIYFIQVDNEFGTYIANGYVCRHEVPPLEHWPNTMSVLLRLLKDPALQNASQFPYTLENIPLFDSLVEEVALKVDSVLGELILPHPRADREEDSEIVLQVMSLKDVDMNECVGIIFGNPTLASIGVGLYGRVGSTVAPYLDSSPVNGDAAEVARIQTALLKIILQELHTSLEKIRPLVVY